MLAQQLEGGGKVDKEFIRFVNQGRQRVSFLFTYFYDSSLRHKIVLILKHLKVRALWELFSKFTKCSVCLSLSIRKIVRLCFLFQAFLLW